MEFVINQQYTLNNMQIALQALWITTQSSEASLENLANYINNHRDVEFFVTNQLEIKYFSSYNTEYVWLDTGYSTPSGDPILISFVESGDMPTGGFFGTVDVIASKISEYHKNYAAEIKKNTSKVKKFIAEERSKRPDEALESCVRDLAGLRYDEIIRRVELYLNPEQTKGATKIPAVPTPVSALKTVADTTNTIETSFEVIQQQITKIKEEKLVSKIRSNSADGSELISVIEGSDNISLAGGLQTGKLLRYLVSVADVIRNSNNQENKDSFVSAGQKMIVCTGAVCSDGTYLTVLYENNTPKKVITNRMQMMDEGFSFDSQIPNCPVKFPEPEHFHFPITSINPDALKEAFEKYKKCGDETTGDIITAAGGEELCYNKIRKELMLQMMMLNIDKHVVKYAYIDGIVYPVIPLDILGEGDPNHMLAFVYLDEKTMQLSQYEQIMDCTVPYNLYS